MWAEWKGSLPLKMTSKNTYFNVQTPFVEFVLYTDEKTATLPKPLTPLKELIFKGAKPASPNSSVLRRSKACLEFFEKSILASYLGFK